MEYLARLQAIYPFNMAPLYVRGGVWTNVEDEILKAAIAKYGLNQWSRVSSLLPKKSAKQCKQRWKEWLDPRIKKLDWDRSEDEKLLQLIKLRPNQWNSIGIMMNRTANQCIERYQQLLGESLETESGQREKDGGNLKLVGNTVDKNEQGEIKGVDTLNLSAESKPARPDPEEMDIDEREMLSEAKARLANTEGKKAKRKARERMLDESKRIAMLQRRRELKQVGINSEIKHKKKFATEMDYNADIAFEIQPKAGRFDISEENNRNLHDKDRFGRKVEDENIVSEEVERQRKKQGKQRRSTKAANSKTSYSSGAQLYEKLDDKEEIKTRSKLHLSAPGEEDAYGDDESQSQANVEQRISDATREIEGRKYERSVLFEARRKKRDLETDESETEHEGGQAVKKAKHHSAEYYKKKKDRQSKKELAKKLSLLPKPIHNNEHLFEGPIGSSVTTDESIRTQGEVLKEHELEISTEEDKLFDTRSQSSKLKLPIPQIRLLNKIQILKEKSKAEEQIMQQTIELMKKDYKEFILKKSGIKNENATTDIRWKKARIEAEKRIKEEMEKIGQKDKEYGRLLAEKSEKGSNIDVKALLQVIKSESEISTALENKFGEVVNPLINSEQEIKDRISEKLQTLQKLNEESIVNELLAEEEKTAIEMRSQRLQQGIDEMNLVISESKEKLTTF